MNRRSTLLIGLSTLALAGVNVAVAGQAQASASDCTAGYYCLFADSNYTNTVEKFHNHGWQTLPSDIIRRGSSMVNRTNYWVIMQDDNGKRYCARPNSEDSSLSNNGFNDHAVQLDVTTSTTKSSSWGCDN